MKLCKDCKWCIPHGGLDDNLGEFYRYRFAKCSNPKTQYLEEFDSYGKARALVSGKTQELVNPFCTTSRLNSKWNIFLRLLSKKKYCFKEGIYFEAKT